MHKGDKGSTMQSWSQHEQVLNKSDSDLESQQLSIKKKKNSTSTNKGIFSLRLEIKILIFQVVFLWAYFSSNTDTEN